MPLTASILAPLVYADHVLAFPLSVAATRENSATGVASHNIPEQFLRALCTAFVDSVKAENVVVLGQVVGMSDLPCFPVLPTPFVLPSTTVAVASFLAAQGWTGLHGAAFAAVAIGSVLSKSAQIGLLSMEMGITVGTGACVVAPLYNPGLASIVEANLNVELLAAFEASGYFAEGDTPGNPVNAILAAQLPKYASALALGFASITASPVYVGTTVGASASTEPARGRIT